jgi:hypothetical protein
VATGQLGVRSSRRTAKLPKSTVRYGNERAINISDGRFSKSSVRYAHLTDHSSPEFRDTTHSMD